MVMATTAKGAVVNGSRLSSWNEVLGLGKHMHRDKKQLLA